MKVLFCASEAVPYAASGGLVDVAGSLPKALVDEGVEVRVVLPLYGQTKEKYGEQLVQFLTYSAAAARRSSPPSS